MFYIYVSTFFSSENKKSFDDLFYNTQFFLSCEFEAEFPKRLGFATSPARVAEW